MTGRHRRAALRRSVLVRAVALAAVPSVALSVLLAGLTSTPVQAADADPVVKAEYARTQTLTRAHLETDRTQSVVDRRTVTVTVDHTTNLRGRQRIGVNWTGAHPSASRTFSPYGQDAVDQEFPVVILQCRGVDDPTLPVAQQLSPQTCWTSSYVQRTNTSPASSSSDPQNRAWVHDRYAPASDREAQQLLPTWPADCPADPVGAVQHAVPFVDAKGKTFPGCSLSTMPPEAGGIEQGALPAADVAAYTSPDGTGTWQFEVRSAQENESLGCSSTVACSLVVIPIMGISCDGTNAGCRASGQSEPGSVNTGHIDPAVQGALWWSASNWKGRFSVPLTFGLTADACDVLDSRPPVDFYGSELLAQASLQWAPAYCLRPDRFKFRANAKSESSSFALVDSGQAVGAFVSYPSQSAVKPLAYAPVAVTGFGISFIVDQPNNTGERLQLKLTPRLLAKLLSQSYTVGPSAKAHPGMSGNPGVLNTDPEFTELNPGLDDQVRDAGAVLLALSESSDTMRALTTYIATDPDAMAFLEGTPDPWGMVVNPDFKSFVGTDGRPHGVQLPLDDWPLLDSWVRETKNPCWNENITTPYLSLVAAPVNSLRKIATALIDAWPNSQTVCEETPTSPLKTGRGARQGYGTRFMLGVVSLGDAERYGLHVAALRTAGTGPGATFVAPSTASMAAAVATATSTGTAQAFTLDPATLPDDAYPGTMIVSAAVPTTGLSSADASHVAQFITTATTEGQVPGPGNGQLPEGFLPITPAGATATLYASAQAAAVIIAKQQGLPASTTTTTTTSGTGTSGVSGGDAAATGSVTGDSAGAAGDGTVTVDGEAAPSTPPSSSTTASGVTPTTTVSAARLAVPVAAGIGLCGALAIPFAFGLGARRPGP